MLGREVVFFLSRLGGEVGVIGRKREQYDIRRVVVQRLSISSKTQFLCPLFLFFLFYLFQLNLHDVYSKISSAQLVCRAKRELPKTTPFLFSPRFSMPLFLSFKKNWTRLTLIEAYTHRRNDTPSEKRIKCIYRHTTQI